VKAQQKTKADAAIYARREQEMVRYIFIYLLLENSKVDSGHRRTKEFDSNCPMGAQN
jgi:hypothetical protein